MLRYSKPDNVLFTPKPYYIFTPYPYTTYQLRVNVDEFIVRRDGLIVTVRHVGPRLRQWAATDVATTGDVGISIICQQNTWVKKPIFN